MKKSPPIAPELFDILVEFADTVREGEADPNDRLTEASDVIVFCQNFYIQLFQNALGITITALDDAAKEKAVRLRRRLAEKNAPATTLQLITWFERLCEIWPDVLDEVYGGGVEDRLAFYGGYVSKLLRRARAWAAATGLEELDKPIERAARAVTEIVDALGSERDAAASRKRKRAVAKKPGRQRR